MTNRLRSYGTAMKEIENADRQETGRWLNNRAESSHLSFRRREREILRFRSMRSLQKYTAIHRSDHNHFNQERHLYSRDDFKLNRAAAVAKRRGPGAVQGALTVLVETSSHSSDSTDAYPLQRVCLSRPGRPVCRLFIKEIVIACSRRFLLIIRAFLFSQCVLFIPIALLFSVFSAEVSQV